MSCLDCETAREKLYWQVCSSLLVSAGGKYARVALIHWRTPHLHRCQDNHAPTIAGVTTQQHQQTPQKEEGGEREERKRLEGLINNYFLRRRSCQGIENISINGTPISKRITSISKSADLL